MSYRPDPITVHYDWVIEEYDGPAPDADIIDATCCETADEMLTTLTRWDSTLASDRRLTIVRDAGSESEGLIDRQWCYVGPGLVLPATFDGGARVPTYLRRAWEKALAKRDARAVALVILTD